MLVENERFIRPSYVNEGDEVIAPWPEKKAGLRCIVACAAGNHARVVNEKYGFDKWFFLYELRVERVENGTVSST